MNANLHAKRILYRILGAFLVPPIMWLAGLWYFDLCTFQQIVAIALTPALAVYVALYLGGVVFLFNRHLSRVKQCLAAPSAENSRQARRSLAFLPIFFLGAMSLYCFIGPNTGLYDKSFLETPTKYMLCWLLGIPIIFVFSVPFFISIIAELEKTSKGIPIAERGKSLSVSGKMMVIFLFTIVGAALTISIGSISTVYMGAGGGLFSLLLGKLAGVGIVLVAVATFSLTMMVRQILMPIRRIAAQMDQVAAGNDAVQIEGLELDDELGEIARAFQANARRMSAILDDGRTRDASAESRRKAELTRVAAEFEHSVASVVASVATAAQEMLAASGQLGANAENTTRQAANVSATTQQTSANVQTVASATEELSASISQIGHEVENAADIARHAVSQAEVARRSVSDLRDVASSIGDVIRLIQDIASQTNLLALNATIEAARAGEAGKGFAVVASEVKSLASQTGRATEGIAAQISAMQEATGNTVLAIDSIGATIGQINEISASIASAVQQQSAATMEISGSIAQAAQGAQGIDANIAGVSEAARQTAMASSRVATNSSQLSRQSDDLKHKVSAFLAALRAA
jgi:methyl-accepting chemotaxis protein